MADGARERINLGPFASPLPTAVLISGGGRTLRNLLERQSEGRLPLDVRLVISSRSDAGGLAHAARHNVPTRIVLRKSFATADAYREGVFQPCREVGAQCVVMAGWLKHVLIPADYENRVVNIHPSLIPSFCGQGMYGHHVHQAVIAAGVRVTGCTVHLVDNEYDHGPIVLQRPVNVRDDDTPDSLAHRVFAAETEALPDALQCLAENRLALAGRRVVHL